MKRRPLGSSTTAQRDDPLWFKDAVIYELHVRAYHDSNGDGIGDFKGLTEKLDYLRDLGVSALWLLPFYPSPLRDGGYDIADYTGVHPDYGTKDDFLAFLHEAHGRGLRVITEIVLNHTSSEHAWFQRARRAPPGSPAREFYVWSDSPDRYRTARIIFQDFESSNWAWDPVAKAYYWHRFYAHQPDLNFENPAVHEAMLGVVDHWLELGVDGIRLDAIPYLYEAEGTSCENLPETHAFLKKLRAHVDARHPNRMLLAEANQWPADAAAYFGDGDECHMNFHFPLMPRLFMAVHLEDAFPIVDILDQTPPIPDACQWATFLRNHDELTLEMVTEEDRDYMYRVYAADRRARLNLGIRRRLAPLLRGRRRIELMNALLLALPGTPVLYYGDEIGMGDNIYLGDRDGVRTPMQWNSDRNAGFSRANPQRLYLPVVVDPEYHYEAVNVEAEQANPSSLLWWTKRLIAQRKRSRVLSRGDIRILDTDNGKILAFLRTHGDDRMLCVANLSRFVQHATLDVRGLEGFQPVEAFGRTRFPRLDRDRWELALASHGFYWFHLETPAPASAAASQPPLRARGRWFDVLGADVEGDALDRIVAFATAQRWYRSKSSTPTRTRARDVVVVDDGTEHFAIVLLDIEVGSSAPQTYVVPLAYTADGSDLAARAPSSVVAHLVVDDPEPGQAPSGTVYDALASRSFARWLLRATAEGATVAGAVGSLSFLDRGGVASLGGSLPEPRPVELDQSNSVLFFGTQLVLKLLRAIDEGANNEDELTTFLTTRSPHRLVPRSLGVVEYVGEAGRSLVGLVSEYVPNQGTAWSHAVEAAHGFFDRVLVRGDSIPATPPSAVAVAPDSPLPEWARELTAPYPALVDLLARRTAELHLLLASATDDPAFAPEPFTPFYRQSLFQSARTSLVKTFASLRRRLEAVPGAHAARIRAVLAREDEVEARLSDIVRGGVDVLRIRIHGDYHLAQVLFTGDDFVILDFEGEPLRALSERRFKRCPLRDVAGMLRSFDYAAETARHYGRLRPDDAVALEPWARAWSAWMGTVFASAYLDALQGAAVVPADRSAVRRLLRFYLLEKCVYEIGYELDNRPASLAVPLRGLEAILAEGSA